MTAIVATRATVARYGHGTESVAGGGAKTPGRTGKRGWARVGRERSTAVGVGPPILRVFVMSVIVALDPRRACNRAATAAGDEVPVSTRNAPTASLPVLLAM